MRHSHVLQVESVHGGGSRPHVTHSDGTALKAQGAGSRKPSSSGGPEEAGSWSGLRARAGSGQGAIEVRRAVLRGRPEAGSLG